jgi:hypothetical protein
MDIDRRKLIVGLAAASPLCVGLSGLSQGGTKAAAQPNRTLAAPTDNTIVRIVLHGLFLLEFKQNALFVTAPKVIGGGVGCLNTSGHIYRGGTRHNLSGDLSGPLDFTTALHGAKASPGFPMEMITFSKGNTGTGVGDISDIANVYQYRLILNFPLAIHKLRKGDASQFAPVGNNVAGKLSYQRFGNIYLSYCLEYSCYLPDIPKLPLNGSNTWQAALTLHFHAEPAQPESTVSDAISHVNSALCQTAAIFKTPSKFDLQIDPQSKPDPVPPEDPKIRGLQLVDELCLGEPEPVSSLGTGTTEGTNVANCVQLGITP